MRNNKQLGEVGQEAVRYIEQLVLVFIAIATVYATFHEIYKMWDTAIVGVADLLLLFLYLEVLSMVKHYLGSGKLAVRYPLYIGMVALARYMILEVKTLSPEHILAVSAAVLVMALAVLAVRYGHVRYPYVEDGDNPNTPITSINLKL
ncbi:MAG: phosphate-starvation-inducible PsiE family protein [Methylotenera sp.]|nr:phosphate-starvation-inducible PsiE family protein [Methylotenera sp.]